MTIITLDPNGRDYARDYSAGWRAGEYGAGGRGRAGSSRRPGRDPRGIYRTDPSLPGTCGYCGGSDVHLATCWSLTQPTES